MKYYRVKYGYGADEFISVNEIELPMAIRAHVGGKRGIFKEGTVSGDKIIAVIPDYQRAMGWSRSHQLSGEDYAEIGREKIEGFQLFLADTEGEIRQQLGEVKKLT